MLTYHYKYHVFQLFFTLHHFAYQGWKHFRNFNRQYILQQTTNNDMIAGNLSSVISDHLIQFLVAPSSFMPNSSKEKITKRCYKKFDKEKFKSDLGKVN